MIASVHLETTNLEHVKTLLEPCLIPNSSVFLCCVDGWVRVYFDQFLDDDDVDDFEFMAQALSHFALTVTCFAEFAPAQVKYFRHGLEIDSDIKLEHPDLGFDDLQELDDLSKLKGFEKLELEVGKPGLAEFFGRSQDE